MALGEDELKSYLQPIEIESKTPVTQSTQEGGSTKDGSGQGGGGSGGTGPGPGPDGGS